MATKSTGNPAFQHEAWHIKDRTGQITRVYRVDSPDLLRDDPLERFSIPIIVASMYGVESLLDILEERASLKRHLGKFKDRVQDLEWQISNAEDSSRKEKEPHNKKWYQFWKWI